MKFLIFSFIVMMTFLKPVFADDKLIKREDLFKDPTCMSIKIDPEGKRLAYVGLDENEHVNIFVTDDLSLVSKKQVTNFTQAEFKRYFWSYDGERILFITDTDGKHLFHLYGANIETGEIVHYTKDFEKINAKVFHISNHENKALIGLNNRNPIFHDLYLLDLESNELSLIYENDRFYNFLVDDNLKVTVKMELNQDGSCSFYNKDEELLKTVAREDAFHTKYLHYDPINEIYYFLDCTSTNTTQLKKFSESRSESEILGFDEKSDIGDVIFENGKPIAYSTYYEYKNWHVLDKDYQGDFNFLESKIGSHFELINKTKDGSIWILKSTIPSKGVAHLIFNRNSKELKSLFTCPNIEDLSNMYPIVVKSRDGIDLVSYLTLPQEYDQNGKVSEAIPLVVIPHGGPFHMRDTYCYHPYHQWLANRGYAVLSVNFRLSSGFGKDHVNAGNGEWGGKAHLDVLDAIEHCIELGVTEKGKIAIFGGSYGGYEALASLSFTSDFFKCGIAICGPSNLKTVMKAVPFFWELQTSLLSDKTVFFTKNAFITSMGGDPDDDNSCEHLEKCSPLNYVDQIKKPLLLIHGANDPIVVEPESKQIYDALSEKQRDVMYLLFPDEGHGIQKFANRMCYLAYSEWFLSKYLKGKYEPLDDAVYKESSVLIESKDLQISLSLVKK